MRVTFAFECHRPDSPSFAMRGCKKIVARNDSHHMPKQLFIGGLVAAGFDSSGAYLLTVSHSGRGVFSTESWERVARDSVLAYPQAGLATGIGPLDGVAVPVNEIDYMTGQLRFSSPDGRWSFVYEEGTLFITETST
jgi:hypothetical protein